MNPDRMEALIYHIAFAKDWYTALDNGEYTLNSLDDEGFIHCSTREQVLIVAERFFRGKQDLLVLEIVVERLPVEVVYEPAENGELFPHVYGVIPVSAVNRVLALQSEPDGSFYCAF
ncbi:MAG: DUF952 domain-containing protein [Chloroflexota bacterium]|jgi:uncharacterized protein (DUF952 family)